MSDGLMTYWFMIASSCKLDEIGKKWVLGPPPHTHTGLDRVKLFITTALHTDSRVRGWRRSVIKHAFRLESSSHICCARFWSIIFLAIWLQHWSPQSRGLSHTELDKRHVAKQKHGESSSSGSSCSPKLPFDIVSFQPALVHSKNFFGINSI